MYICIYDFISFLSNSIHTQRNVCQRKRESSSFHMSLTNVGAFYVFDGRKAKTNYARTRRFLCLFYAVCKYVC